MNVDYLTQGFFILSSLDEEEYTAEEKLWGTILGVNPYYWTGNTDKVSESNRNLVGKSPQ
jgi:hypothetical protein